MQNHIRVQRRTALYKSDQQQQQQTTKGTVSYFGQYPPLSHHDTEDWVLLALSVQSEQQQMMSVKGLYLQ